jgi:hypothetical protein
VGVQYKFPPKRLIKSSEGCGVEEGESRDEREKGEE